MSTVCVSVSLNRSYGAIYLVFLPFQDSPNLILPWIISSFVRVNLAIILNAQIYLFFIHIASKRDLFLIFLFTALAFIIVAIMLYAYLAVISYYQALRNKLCIVRNAP